MRRRASAALLCAALIAGTGLAGARGAKAQQVGDTLARPGAAAPDSDFVVVQGRLFTADARPPAGLRVFFRTAERVSAPTMSLARRSIAGSTRSRISSGPGSVCAKPSTGSGC